MPGKAGKGKGQQGQALTFTMQPGGMGTALRQAC